ncbi:MAG: hypothetical protein U0521_19500 [Anaerolineae bacterium]
MRSWLLDLIANALQDDPNFRSTIGRLGCRQRRRSLTVGEAIDLDIPAPGDQLPLMMRFVSRQDESYAGKLPAAMRNQFGGHAVMRE